LDCKKFICNLKRTK